MLYIILYLTAIVLANLSSAYFGPPASIVNALLFIGLDLTARDKLHDAWHRRGLLWKMPVLIAVGSLFSWWLNRNAGQIAIASFVAFCCAALTDTVIYCVLRERDYLIRVNGSNIGGAIIDSVVFPTLAFGGFMPLITIGQAIAKIFGGALWSLILRSQKTLPAGVRRNAEEDRTKECRS